MFLFFFILKGGITINKSVKTLEIPILTDQLKVSFE